MDLVIPSNIEGLLCELKNDGLEIISWFFEKKVVKQVIFVTKLLTLNTWCMWTMVSLALAHLQ